jgi:hypothetical protein
MIDIEEELENCVFIDDFKKMIDRLATEREDLISRLDEAADILVAAGCIHNTPYSRRQWIDGGVDVRS